MTQHECIRAIAQKHYEIRMKEGIGGTKEGDWRFADMVYRFFADCTSPRTAEWENKMEDYEPYIEIYEQNLWVA